MYIMYPPLKRKFKSRLSLPCWCEHWFFPPRKRLWCASPEWPLASRRGTGGPDSATAQGDLGSQRKLLFWCGIPVPAGSMQTQPQGSFLDDAGIVTAHHLLIPIRTPLFLMLETILPRHALRTGIRDLPKSLDLGWGLLFLKFESIQLLHLPWDYHIQIPGNRESPVQRHSICIGASFKI